MGKMMFAFYYMILPFCGSVNLFTKLLNISQLLWGTSLILSRLGQIVSLKDWSSNLFHPLWCTRTWIIFSDRITLDILPFVLLLIFFAQISKWVSNLNHIVFFSLKDSLNLCQNKHWPRIHIYVPLVICSNNDTQDYVKLLYHILYIEGPQTISRVT